MICPHCSYPNPNGFTGVCKSCKQPMEVKPVAQKPQSTPKKSTGKAVTKKSAKK